MQAHEVVDLLRKQRISSEELIDIASQRIDDVEPKVNALPTLCEQRARDALHQWREQPFDIDEPGWLGGLPIAIKDLNAVKGVRTTFGTPGLADFIPDFSDPLVERLENRGGLVMGKSNTPEMGAGGNTFNAVFGMTRNPWNTSKNAGGSSGGAAVSLASGEVWLSHGSDLAGSLRTPAGYCAVVGLRPTPGRAGSAPADLGFNTEAVQGPMARSVMDCALFLDAMAGFNPASPISFPAPDAPFQDAVRRANNKVKIAYSPDLNGFASVSKEVDDILRRALVLVEKQGGIIDEQCPELPELGETYRVLRAMLWAAGPGYLPDQVQQAYKHTLQQNIEVGRQLHIDEVYRAQRARTVIFRNMYQLLLEFDVLACPVVGLVPGPVEEEYPKEIDGKVLTDYIEWLDFSYLSTATGLPSISVPAGFSDQGMPIGLQLIGRPRGEAELLAAARVVERAVGGPFGPIDPNVTHSMM